MKKNYLSKTAMSANPLAMIVAKKSWKNMTTAWLLLLFTVFGFTDVLGQSPFVDNNTATPEEEHTWKILSQYVKYEAAAFLLPQFQMLVVQKISDGDVEMARFQNNNLQDTINRILTMRDKYKNMLRGDAGLLPVSVGLGLFSTVQPSYDPVTNEGTF